ncbi:unnamed protein product [Allacma fusca]|uniref:Gonadal protein gdl n=1 Tax=Allacma fusca TaxID=39272 RepID=A0A8J2KS93_9HEXA|nr:unnamed protein product [Allacma fusca]
MAREIPPKYQQRMPQELLSGLANTLLHDTIFEIVKGLKEIQDVAEKLMFQTRVKLREKHQVERQLFRQQVQSKPSMKMKELLHRQKKDMKNYDMKVVMNMDQKVSDQQVMLEKAGVPGFYVTNNPPEIQLQMYILDFILKLSQMPLPTVALE